MKAKASSHQQPPRDLGTLADDLIRDAARTAKAIDGRPAKRKRVHKVRVATRRAEAAATMLGVADPLHAKPVRRLNRAISRLRRAAGRVRDLDVVLKLIKAGAAQTHAPLEDEARAWVAKSLRRERRKRAERLAESIGKRARRVGRRRRSLNKALSPQSGARLKPSLWEAIRLRAEGVSAAARLESDDVDSLHRLRITLKALKYTMELLGDEPGPARRARTMADRLADELGACHDLAMAAQRLRKLAEDASRRVRPGVRALAHRLDVEGQALVARAKGHARASADKVVASVALASRPSDVRPRLRLAGVEHPSHAAGAA